MSWLLTESGQPLFDGVGDDLVLQDTAGLVLLDAQGRPIVLGGSGLPIQDGLSDPTPASTTDAAGMAARMRALLPDRWFSDDTPVLGALLRGLGATWAAIYDQIAFAGSQTRIATATGAFLDLSALDYLGGSILRNPGEDDQDFSTRIRREIIRPRATRAALVQVLTDLSGRASRVFEPARPTDTGGYGTLGMTQGTGLGYGLAGGWGSLDLPNQVFVNAYRAIGGGIPNVGGYYAGSGWAGGGYGLGALQYASLDMGQGQVTDADIYEAVSSVMPVAGIAWTSIQN